MEKKRIYGCISILAISTLGIVLILVFSIYIGPNMLNEKRAASAPPTVIVHAPSSGDTSAEGELLTASATATSRNQIARLELWLDGEKYQEQAPQGSLNNFYASFEIDMPEGVHLLVFRAVDSEGLVGQSLPIAIEGTTGIATLTIAEEGQTLQDIAEALGAQTGEIQNFNPGLGNGGLPSGTNVNVPAPPAQGGAGKSGQPPGGGGGQGTPPGGQPDPGQGAGKGKAGNDPNNASYEVLPTVIPDISFFDMTWALFSNRPAAPDSLYASYKDCAVELNWHDNAKNETHFNIWMQRVYGPPQLIATTKDNPFNGPTTYKFKTPASGFYNFWVEAANSLGSQASEIKQVYVPGHNCGLNLATSLEIEALDMYVFAPYNQIYCYLSLDGSDYRLIPESGFIQVQNNWGDITKHWGGEKKITYIMPEDEELTIEGSCLAELGPLMVSPLTSFKTSVPREKWDGSRLEIKTDAFLVGYRVQPLGPEKAQGAFEYVNYGLNAPDVWNVEAQAELQFPEKDWKARTVTVSWHWKGNPDEINSFLILLDGKGIRYVNRGQRQESILMGSACGQEYTFQVVAIGPDGARSAPGSAFHYQQPPCPVMAEVQFLTVYSNATDDTDCVPPFMNTCMPYLANACNPLGVFYEIWAQGAGNKRIVLKYGSSQIPFHYECGIEYQFSNQLNANPDKIIVPVDPSFPQIRFGTIFWEDDGVGDDKFGVTDMPIHHDYDKWPSVDEIITLTVPMLDETADAIIKVRVRGWYQTGP